MGVQRAGEELPRLNPPKREAITIDSTDQLVLLGDAFD